MAAERSPSEIRRIRTSASLIFCDQLLVPRTIQDDDNQIFNAPVEPLGNHPQVIFHGCIQVHGSTRRWTDDNFFHAAIWSMEKTALF